MAITEQQIADLVPQLTGEVEVAFEVESELSTFFPVEKINGTDTKLDRVAGRAHVQAINWAQDDKDAQTGTFGTITYKIEDSIYIRHAEKNISALISDIDALKELGFEHGKALALQRDLTILTALLIGSRQSAMASSGVAGVAAGDELDNVVLEGIHAVFAASGDEADVAKVEYLLEQMIIAQKARRKFDKSGTMLVVSHAIYNVLRQSDKLMSTDYSRDNGDFAKGIVNKFMNVPLMPITIFQDMQGQAGTTNPIGTTWNIEMVDQEARAVLFTPRALRVLEAMPVTVDAWYEKSHKLNYIDSQAYYGVGVRRQDYIAALYHFNASNIAVVTDGSDITSNLTATITVV